MAATAKARPMCASLPKTEGPDGEAAARPTIEELNELAKDLSALVDEFVAEITETPSPSTSIEEARAEALSLINSRRNECASEQPSDPACEAIAKFEAAGRLATSGVDIMATAFLTPKCLFLAKSEAYDGNEHYLAAEFKLPLSAIVLRKKMLSLYKD